jgi:hypothetical protein
VGSTTLLEPHTARAKSVLLLELLRGEIPSDALGSAPVKEVNRMPRSEFLVTE